MAKKPESQRPEHELRQEIAHSRDRLARDLDGLRYELDFPLKFRKSFQRKTAVWLTAAIVIGLIITVRPAKKKIVVKPKAADGEETKKGILGAGLAVAAGKIVGSIVRPLIISYATKKLGAMADPKMARKM